MITINCMLLLRARNICLELKKVIALGQEFSRSIGRVIVFADCAHAWGQAEMERWLVRLLTSVISHSML